MDRFPGPSNKLVVQGAGKDNCRTIKRGNAKLEATFARGEVSTLHD